jgi:two-component sensor histidine kinase
MDHRVKNLFAVSSSVVSVVTLSARSARTPEELASAVGERLEVLARAHAGQGVGALLGRGMVKGQLGGEWIRR